MDVVFVPADLARWGEPGGDLLAVCLWTDVRPLRGAAGLLDWRMCGRLSSWIEGGRLSGACEEQTLFPSGRRVPWRMVLVLGLGAVRDFSEGRFREAIRRVAGSARGLGARRLAIAPPGRESDRIAPRRAVEILLEETRGAPLDEIAVIDRPAAHKEMAEVVRRSRDDARA